MRATTNGGMTRRVALGTAAGLVVAAPAALAQQAAPGAKGPPVWLDMDQAALDAAYDQAAYAPNLVQVVKRWASTSEAARARLGPPKRLAYGPTPIEGLDLYPAARADAPIHVFIHGGAWRTGLAKDSAYAAEAFVHSGAHFIVPDFINVLEAGGDLMPMADQVRRAIAWVHANAASFGGDRNRIYLSAHSSGAHLAGVALVTDWHRDFGLPADVVKAALLCSGMYELTPVRLSARGNYVKFTDGMVEALSTQRHLDRLDCPLVVAHASLDTPEFQRQSRAFAAAVAAAGKPVKFLLGENYNHFELIETLANPYGLLGRAALEQMNL